MSLDRRAMLLDAVQRAAASVGGIFAFAARNLTIGETLGLHADRVMPTALTIKLAVLVELFRRVDRGDLRLDQQRALIPDDHRGGSGILKDLQPDLSPTLHDLATLMVALSDSVATAGLARLLGQQPIIQTMHDWRLPSVAVLFRVPEGGDTLDYGRAASEDLVGLLDLFESGDILSAPTRDGIRAILRTQQYNDQIPRHLPYDPYARDLREAQRIEVGSKSGFTRGIRVDAGLVWMGEQCYAIAAIHAHSADLGFAPEQGGCA